MAATDTQGRWRGWRVLAALYVGLALGCLLGGAFGLGVAVLLENRMGSLSEVPIDQQSNELGTRMGMGVLLVGLGLYAGGFLGIAAAARVGRHRGAWVVAAGSLGFALAISAIAWAAGTPTGGKLMWLVVLAPVFGRSLSHRIARPRSPLESRQ